MSWPDVRVGARSHAHDARVEESFRSPWHHPGLRDRTSFFKKIKIPRLRLREAGIPPYTRGIFLLFFFFSCSHWACEIWHAAAHARRSREGGETGSLHRRCLVSHRIQARGLRAPKQTEIMGFSSRACGTGRGSKFFLLLFFWSSRRSTVFRIIRVQGHTLLHRTPRGSHHHPRHGKKELD